jgi:hypothetical protein
MTKRQAREFYWFSQGFTDAALKLRQAALECDPTGRRKRTHVARGAFAASMLLDGDLRQRQKRKGK